MKNDLKKVVFGMVIAFSCVIDARADAVIATVRTSPVPDAIAIDSVTDKIYVPTNDNGILTIIDGATNATTTLGPGEGGAGGQYIAVNPVTNRIYVTTAYVVTVINGMNNSTLPLTTPMANEAIAVNPVTNMIYLANSGDSSAWVINGANNSMVRLIISREPSWLKVNPITNRIWVGDYIDSFITVINGANNSTATVSMAPMNLDETFPTPDGIAVNPVTNLIYAANYGSNTVTVINGATDSTAIVTAGIHPVAIAVNPMDNMIYVANEGSDVTVIDGATNSTTTAKAGSRSVAIAVNPVTNKIYVANFGDSSVSVIDGTTLMTSTLRVGNHPVAVAVNSATNKIYAVNWSDSSVTVIDGSATAIRSITPQFKTSSAIGYNGTLAVYSLNGRQIFKTLFGPAATKESLLHAVNNKTLANGVYKYYIHKDQKIMDEGSFLVR
jgi:YVTN family beta-propeller protein